MPRSSRRRASHQRDLVGFKVDGLSYAVPIDAVREIIRPLPLVEVPHAPACVVGVADHRDAVVPVVDLRLLFGRSPIDATRRTKWVIVGRRREASVGLLVDSVSDVFGVSDDSARAVPAWARAQAEAGMGDVVSWNGELVFVLRPDVLMKPALAAMAEQLP